ncbi:MULTISPECIES: hypothetical protein [unclassified Pseudovibrio]|uniref:hypothetical protein n=1 Tax=unclassified Pseudovibrio TaxID=2627060 RepID=UPI0007AE6ADC|nr:MULTISPECIES: hypothetical protein [unclassified Pseudovibrio]KZL00514.1 hypothetical protein PsW74_02940 [Pseudovibrio sp. W74]KZL07689.1 hypothetical protein PsAD14_04079 [Pseudovibrio sp. Ad14]
MRKTVQFITISLVILFCRQTVHAESLTSYEAADAALLSSIDAVKIHVFDNVTDGCLPSPNRLKNKMEITLRKNGFSVVGSDVKTDAVVVITALGMKPGSSCVVHVKTSILIGVISLVPKSSYVKPGTTAYLDREMQIGAIVLTGGNMQQRLTQVIEGHADDLSLAILRAREFQFEYR